MTLARAFHYVGMPIRVVLVLALLTLISPMGIIAIALAPRDMADFIKLLGEWIVDPNDNQWYRYD